MGSDENFLITILNGNTLLRVAMKVDRGQLDGDVELYPMEPENRDKLHHLLPHHVKSIGPIVDVEIIFEITA